MSNPTPIARSWHRREDTWAIVIALAVGPAWSEVGEVVHLEYVRPWGMP